MDPYERLVAINESLMGKIKGFFKRKPESETTEETPETRRKKIFKAIDQAANTTEDPNRVAARLKAYYDKQDSGDSPFGRSILDSFNPSKDPNAEADQEYDDAAQALRDAGIAYKALKRIGSLNREKDIFKVNRRDMRLAREVMQDFPNAQIKRA